MNRLSAAPAQGEVVQDRADPEGREDVCGDLETELAPDVPGLRVGRFSEIDLATHDHVDKLVTRGEPLRLDAQRVLRVLVPGNTAGTLEIAEGGTAARIEQRPGGGVGVLGG